MTPVSENHHSTAFFIVNVEVAVLRDGRYLATTRGAGETCGAGWVGFPGGKLEGNLELANALEDTARREVFEETGIHLVGPVVYVESHTFGDPETLVLDVVMLARAAEGTPHITDPEEVAAIEWLTYDQIMAHSSVQPWTRESLELVDRIRTELGW